MNNATTTKKTAKRNKKIDWSRFDALTPAQRSAAALGDPDAQPVRADDLKRMPRVPQVKVIRRALKLSQEDFANPALRAGFVQLNRAATGQVLPEADDDWLELIADVQLADDASVNINDETFLREQAVRTALRLREQNLRRDRAAVAMMTDEAQANNDRPLASQYNLQLQGVNTRLLRVQKALRLRSMITIV